MPTCIRTVEVAEFDTFEAFIERCFGHSATFFHREFPHVYRPSGETCRWLHVLEQDGRIVAHLTIYPAVMRVSGAAMPAGGIGAVCSDPGERGSGHMTRMLRHAIEQMRADGQVLSYLGGDRQRYGTLGWECTGPVYRLRFSPRSLERAGVAPAALRQVVPREASDLIERLHANLSCRMDRPLLALQLGKREMRAWVAEHGYALVRGEDRNHLSVMEVYSEQGDEAGILRAMLEWTGGQSAELPVATADPRAAALMDAACSWSSAYGAMYRIVSLEGLFAAHLPRLRERAAALRDFDVALVMHEHDRDDAVTLRLAGGDLSVERGAQSATRLDLSPVNAARLVLGGPPTAAHADAPPGLLALLPLPVYVPPLDDI